MATRYRLRAIWGPLISGSGAIMPLHFYVVKCFVVLFSRHYIIAEKTTCRSVSGLLVESVYFDPQGHVIPVLSRVVAGSGLLSGLALAVDAGQGDPLA